MYRTRLGSLSNQTEPNPIIANPLGLLIVLNKTGRRRQSIGQKSTTDGNRSDDNETSAFSYSSDTDDEDDEGDYYSNEDRRAYFSELNEEFALAMTLDNKQFNFNPCRRIAPDSHKKRKKKDGENGRTVQKRNIYKLQNRDKSPDDQRPKANFLGIGKFFGKLKRHDRDHDRDRDRDDDRHRKLSLQTNSSSPDTEDGSETPGEYRFHNSSYDDPTAFLKQVKEQLLSDMKQSGDVSV